jgi:ABC-type microcin C transport system duplicated ATPase subunit YejF
MRDKQTPLLEVNDLAVEFGGRRNATEVVRSASLAVSAGEVVGLVGESGSGKTVTSMATMGLVPVLGGRIVRGQIHLHGRDVTHLPQSEWRALRGSTIGMVFQQPMRSLNPALTVGEQIAESVRRHLGESRKAARHRAVEMLDRVGVADAAKRVRDYPHESPLLRPAQGLPLPRRVHHGPPGVGGRAPREVRPADPGGARGRAARSRPRSGTGTAP